MDVVSRLWMDDSGFIVSIELVLISTIVVFGLIAGLAALRDAIVSEISDVAGAVQDLNQSYSFTGTVSPSARAPGSDFTDRRDWCDTVEDQVDQIDNCINVFGVQNEF